MSNVRPETGSSAQRTSGFDVQGRTPRVATVLMYLSSDTALAGGETAFTQVSHCLTSQYTLGPLGQYQKR